jgi:hypothetical protein
VRDRGKEGRREGGREGREGEREERGRKGEREERGRVVFREGGREGGRDLVPKSESQQASSTGGEVPAYESPQATRLW